MVEHRTENSGVGGSNPSIGRIQYYFLKLLLLSKIKQKHVNKVLIDKKEIIVILSKTVVALKQPLITLPSFYHNKWSRSKGLNNEILLLKRFNDRWWVILNIFSKHKVEDKSLTNSTWFLVFLQLYVQSYTGYNFNWYFYNYDKTVKNSLFSVWWRKLKVKKIFKIFFKKWYFKVKFLFNLVLRVVFFKHIDQIALIISRVLTLLSIKKHKRYFYYAKSMVGIFFKVLQNRGNLLGYSLRFKGKLGRKGSVKKSTFFYKFGRVSLTNKSLRLNYKKFLIYTETGVIGGEVVLYY